MTRRVSAREARSRFAELTDRVRYTGEPVIVEKVKTLGEDLASIEQDLALGKGVRSLEQAKQKVKEHERLLSSMQDRIQQAEERLKTVEHEAVVNARKILQDARDEAAKLVKASEAVVKTTQQKLTEVEGREQAVAWVASEDLRLKAEVQRVAQLEAQANALLSSANATQELCAMKLEEVRLREEAVAKREVEVPA